MKWTMDNEMNSSCKGVAPVERWFDTSHFDETLPTRRVARHVQHVFDVFVWRSIGRQRYIARLAHTHTVRSVQFVMLPERDYQQLQRPYCPTNKVTTVVYMEDFWKRLYSKVSKGWYEAWKIKTATTTSKPNCTYTMIIDKNNNTFFRTYLISWVLWKCYAKNGQDSFFYQPHHFPPTYTQRVHPGKYK